MMAENSTSPGASKEEKVDDIETFYHSRDDLLAFVCYRRHRILPRVKERLLFSFISAEGGRCNSIMQRAINPYTFREERPCVEDGAGVVASRR
jgi:hypothetical protein